MPEKWLQLKPIKAILARFRVGKEKVYTPYTKHKGQTKKDAEIKSRTSG